MQTLFNSMQDTCSMCSQLLQHTEQNGDGGGNEYFYPEWKKHSDVSILLYFQDCGGQRQGLANSYSDIRVKTMGLHYPYDRVVGQLATPLLFYTIYSGIEKEFDYFCNTLKEQRITCSHLHTYPEIKLTKEQCAELLDVL